MLLNVESLDSEENLLGYDVIKKGHQTDYTLPFSDAKQLTTDHHRIAVSHVLQVRFFPIPFYQSLHSWCHIGKAGLLWQFDFPKQH